MAALHVAADGRHRYRRRRTEVDDGRGTAGGVGERGDSGPVKERMGEEDRPEGAGDGPEQLAGATGATSTGFEVGEAADGAVPVLL